MSFSGNENRKTRVADKADQTGRAIVPIQDLHKPEYYLNRELSWLKFNWRVLNEASDPRTLLLDRVKFLAIVSSNIDQFWMKRIGGLQLQASAKVIKLSSDGRDPATQIALCRDEVAAITSAKEEIYTKTILELEENQIIIRDYSGLSRRRKREMRAYYLAEVHPLITPQAIDASHPFPFVSNLSLNLFATFRRRGKKKIVQSRVKVPVGAGLPRFIKLQPSNNRERAEFVRLEDIMMNNLDLIFPAMDVLTCDLFRITRSTHTAPDRSDDVVDLVESIESRLRKRRFAPIMRLQVSRSMQKPQRASLVRNLGLDEGFILQTASVMPGLADLMELSLLNRPALRRPRHQSVKNYALQGDEDIFSQIDAHKSILLQHPYECFESSVERFVKEASTDSQVRAIKMTIYRTSTGTRIVDHLIKAAKNGKHVTVVVELTASFDEQANIGWAAQLKQAGIHVSYGVDGLKTHCKIILVVRKVEAGLRRYAHIGTGNYHASNARNYSDLGLLTCDPELTVDLSDLFNALTTRCAPVRDYGQILTAPLYIKASLLDKISREAAFARQGRAAHIRFKTNALEDPDITAALYAASQAGVKVELIIRDICRLRPGLKGISESINVVSIVGQFLEHSRIYHFHNAGDDEYFIGSADLMTRNLERRVEILIPVKDTFATSQISWILQSQLSDQRCAWDMHPNGEYEQRVPAEDTVETDSQEAAIAEATARTFSTQHR